MTCPVALFPASSKSQKTRFHQINRQTGNRLRQQMVDEETGRAVDTDNRGRGYELSKGKYVEIEPDEIDAIEYMRKVFPITRPSEPKRLARAREQCRAGPQGCQPDNLSNTP